MLQLPDFLLADADGEIRLKGHRIRLIDVAARYEEGRSPEAIVLDYYPTLDLPLVHKAIAFYLEHEGEVNSLIRQNEEAMRRLEADAKLLPRTTPTWEELRRRMKVQRQAEAL